MSYSGMSYSGMSTTDAMPMSMSQGSGAGLQGSGSGLQGDPMSMDLGDGPLQRQRAAADLVHQQVTADTQDHEDHTFAGVMFDVRTRDLRAAEYIEIASVWLRGDLGPITVWSCPGGYAGKHESEDAWTCHYKRVHNASPTTLVECKLSTPIRVAPGVTCGIYAHSACPGDDQIVYDNQRNHVSHADLFLDILPGLAHLSDQPFSGNHQFMGWWGRPWRERREFVGRLSYGVRWLLWNPDVHDRFPKVLQDMMWSVYMSRHARAQNSFLHYLDDEQLFYIMNMVEWWDMDACTKALDDVAPKSSVEALPRMLHPYGRDGWEAEEEQSNEEEYDEADSGDDNDEDDDDDEDDEDGDDNEDDDDEGETGVPGVEGMEEAGGGSSPPSTGGRALPEVGASRSCASCSVKPAGGDAGEGASDSDD